MTSPYLALDIGMHRTGVAVSEGGRLAQPLSTVAWKAPHHQPMLQEIVALCQHYAIATLIIGVPLSEDNIVTSQALKTEQYIQQLQDLLNTANLSPEIVRVNEFHSTQDAQRSFPDVDKDAAAAAILLQDYLDEHGGTW